MASSVVATEILKCVKVAHSAFKISFCAVKYTCPTYQSFLKMLKSSEFCSWLSRMRLNVSSSLYWVSRPYSEDNYAKYISVWRRLWLSAGDFWQTVPVVSSGFRAQIVNVYLQSSFFCNSFKSLQLTVNIRLQSLLQYPATSEEVVQFPQFLLYNGEGKVPPGDSNYIATP